MGCAGSTAAGIETRLLINEENEVVIRTELKAIVARVEMDIVGEEAHREAVRGNFAARAGRLALAPIKTEATFLLEMPFMTFIWIQRKIVIVEIPGLPADAVLRLRELTHRGEYEQDCDRQPKDSTRHIPSPYGLAFTKADFPLHDSRA